MLWLWWNGSHGVLGASLFCTFGTPAATNYSLLLFIIVNCVHLISVSHALGVCTRAKGFNNKQNRDLGGARHNTATEREWGISANAAPRTSRLVITLRPKEKFSPHWLWCNMQQQRRRWRWRYMGVECIQQQGESFAAVNFILILASCVRMAQKQSAGKRTRSERVSVSIAPPTAPSFSHYLDV